MGLSWHRVQVEWVFQFAGGCSLREQEVPAWQHNKANGNRPAHA